MLNASNGGACLAVLLATAATMSGLISPPPVQATTSCNASALNQPDSFPGIGSLTEQNSSCRLAVKLGAALQGYQRSHPRQRPEPPRLRAAQTMFTCRYRRLSDQHGNDLGDAVRCTAQGALVRFIYSS